MTQAFPIWNIPYQRNPFFTGREDVLQSLHNSLRIDYAAALTQPQGISGLGGIGKTQTAIEYAYRYQHNYRMTLWVRADSRGILISDFMTIAHLLNLPEKDERDQDLIVAAVMRWLKEHTHWLLILDNVEDLALANEFIPSAYRGHILLTTRSQALGAVAHRIEIEKMQTQEGGLFLLRRASIIAPGGSLDDASSDDRIKAMEISQAMDGLPLALEQAGAYIEEIGCGLTGYLDLYQKHQTQLLKESSKSLFDYPASVATTWSLSFEKVTQANPSAADLLQLCAFLYPDAIPEEIIIEGAPDLGSVLQPVATDPIALNAAIKELRKFSLLHRESDLQTLTIHRLVQTVLKDSMDENLQRQWAERTVRAVYRAFPEGEFTEWPRCQRCLPHAQACRVLIEQWNIELPESVYLLNRVGFYLEARSQYKEAEQSLQHALMICEKFEPDHPVVASILNALAIVYTETGKYEEAEPLLRRALAIDEQAYGLEHHHLLPELNSLAQLYYAQGNYTQAEPLLLRFLSIGEKTLKPEDPTIAYGLNTLGMLYLSQGKYDQAEPLFKHALAIGEQLLGLEHPNVGTALNNLAMLYYVQGNYTHAEPLFQRALTLFEKILEPDEFSLSMILNALATLYLSQGKYDQAEPLYRRALLNWEKVLGPENPTVATVLNNLAMLYNNQSRYLEAEPLFQRALLIREKTLEPEHPDVAQSLNNLALFHYAQGNYAQAELLFQRALRIFEKTLGPEHPDTAQIMSNLASLYNIQDRYVDAEPLFQRSLAIFEKTLDPGHPRLVTALKNYAKLLRKTKRENEAEELDARARALEGKHSSENLPQ